MHTLAHIDRYEAESQTCPRLRMMLARNAIEQRVTVLNYAGRFGLRLCGDGFRRRDSEGVADVLQMAGVEEVDLMKMNIHESEYDVLLTTPPSVRRRVPESHEAWLSVD